jgi:hypothetical protein
VNLDNVIRTLPKPLTISVVKSEFSGREMTEIRPDRDVTARGRQRSAANRANRRADHARRAAGLRATGLPVPHVARTLGLSERYVRRLLEK